MPAKYADQAPEGRAHRAPATTCGCSTGRRSPTSGSTRSPAARRRSTASTRPSFDEMRPGCYDIHERVKDMSAGGVLASMCFPSFPSFSGRLFAGADDKDLALAVDAGLQRLAHRRVGRHLSRALHPDGAAGAVGPRAVRRRDPAGRGQGLPLDHVHREPGRARLPQLPRRALGPDVARAGRGGDASSTSTSVRRDSSRSPRPTRRWT